MFWWNIEFFIEGFLGCFIHAANGGCKLLVDVTGFPLVDMGPSAAMEVAYMDIVSDGNFFGMFFPS